MARYGFGKGWEVGKSRTETTGKRIAFWFVLLAAGSVGLWVAYSRGTIASLAKRLPDEWAAEVDGRPILKEVVQRRATELARASGTGNPGSKEMRLALDQVIDETVLADRSMELGLGHSDDGARRTLADLMRKRIASESTAATPSDEVLRAHYEQNTGRYGRGERVLVREIYIRQRSAEDAAEALRRATEASKSLAGSEEFQEVDGRIGNKNIDPLPDYEVSESELARRRSPEAAREVFRLPEGKATGPIRGSNGYHVFQVVKKVADEPMKFEDVKDKVAYDVRDASRAHQIAEYTERLRARSKIRVHPSFAQSGNKRR